MADEVIIVQPNISNITVEPIIPNVVITSPGPQGAPGSAGVFYVHTQAVASAVWTIVHNLNAEPTAVVLDSAGTNCEGSFSYPNKQTMVITFNASFAGTAYII